MCLQCPVGARVARSYANSSPPPPPHPRPLNSLPHKTPNPILLTPSPKELLTTDSSENDKSALHPLVAFLVDIGSGSANSFVRREEACFLFSSSSCSLAATNLPTSLSSPRPYYLRFLDLKGCEGRFEKDWQGKCLKLAEANWQVPIQVDAKSSDSSCCRGNDAKHHQGH